MPSRPPFLEHILFYGQPGLGKTTLALLMANEMKTNCKVANAPSIERPRDIVGLLLGLKEGILENFTVSDQLGGRAYTDKEPFARRQTGRRSCALSLRIGNARARVGQPPSLKWGSH